MTAVLPSSRRLVPPLLRDVPFRRYWLGQTISMLGDEVHQLVLPLVAVLALGADAGDMGLLTAAGLLPSLLFSLHAGAWADRRTSRRRVMIASDVARAVLVASIPVAYLLDVLTFGQLLVVAFVIGVFSVLFEVCQPTLFVSLVGKGDYVSGNSLVNGSRAMSFIAGPGVGGALVQVVAAPLALLVDAVSFLASALFLGRIAPAEPRAADSQGGVRVGLRYIFGSPVMRSALGATATLNLFNFVFHALFVLFATTTLGLSAGLLGALLAAGAVGGVIGAVVTGRVVSRLGFGRAIVLSFVLFPAPLMLVPAAGGPLPLVGAMVCAAEFLAGFGVMLLDISVGSLFAATIPPALRSRVSGAYRMINYGVRPIGAALGGWLGTVLGVRPTLWIATIGALAAVLWLLPSPVARMATLPDPEQ